MNYYIIQLFNNKVIDVYSYDNEEARDKYFGVLTIAVREGFEYQKCNVVC